MSLNQPNQSVQLSLNELARVKTMGKVAVLFGGASAESEVSQMSGSGVLEALRSIGVDAHAFDPAKRSLQALKDENFDRAFIALHGRFGEDGTVQGALELLGIPYTGSGVTASAVAMDKVMTKRLWSTYDLPIPQWREIDSSIAQSCNPIEHLREIPDALGLPLIFKPPHEGSSNGVTKVVAYSELTEAFAKAARYDSVVLAEEFIQGRELTVTILGSGQDARALPVIEIFAPEGDYDFHNKYYGETKYECPANLPKVLSDSLQSIALKAYRVLGCEGWGRADFMLRDSDQAAFLLEMNTSPGMTGHSLVPMAASAQGISYGQLCLEILASASLKISRVQRKVSA